LIARSRRVPVNDLAFAPRQRETIENFVIALNKPQPRHDLTHAQHPRIRERPGDLIVGKCRRVTEQRILGRRHRHQGIDAQRVSADFIEE